MDTVNVLFVSRTGMHDGFLDEVAKVSPRISAKDGMEQFVSELRSTGNSSTWTVSFDKEIRRSVRCSLIKPKTEENLDTLLSEAEVIFGVLLFPEDLHQRAPKLKWLHIASSGIDSYLPTGVLDANITITNSSGVLAIPIAEHTLALMLGLAKNIPRLVENKRRRLWERFSTLELCAKTLGIIGLGKIGTEVARLAKGIGMRVVAIKRHAPKRQSGVFGVDELYPAHDLSKMLAESDFLVIAAPLTSETRGMIGEQQLTAMKSTAYIINIARGAIIDEAALTRALKEGWIAGAGLDTFETEPLPTESELWDMPNVILSSHISSHTERRSHRMIDFFCQNLSRYLAGQQLLNILDVKKEY